MLMLDDCAWILNFAGMLDLNDVKGLSVARTEKSLANFAFPASSIPQHPVPGCQCQTRGGMPIQSPASLTEKYFPPLKTILK
ncbi:MAG TPA: hypothetical protein VD816_11540 [Ohtaekwangia sp.]|nr:hypothetical protein [Ohtaekwangia sp.]